MPDRLALSLVTVRNSQVAKRQQPLRFLLRRNGIDLRRVHRDSEIAPGIASGMIMRMYGAALPGNCLRSKRNALEAPAASASVETIEPMEEELARLCMILRSWNMPIRCGLEPKNHSTVKFRAKDAPETRNDRRRRCSPRRGARRGIGGRVLRRRRRKRPGSAEFSVPLRTHQEIIPVSRSSIIQPRARTRSLTHGRHQTQQEERGPGTALATLPT